MSKRVSLIFKDADEESVAPYLEPESAERKSLERWALERKAALPRSEAAILRLLLQAGAEAVREQALDIAYESMAVEFNAESLGSDRRAARDRYAARSDAHR